MKSIVAIVGRPNVGKSTLFNRLTESLSAIVDATSGVTRDRHYGNAEWRGRAFSVIDTGGYLSGTEDIFEEEIRKHVNIAIQEADIIIFMVDVTTGITQPDTIIADMLRKSGKTIFLVANKVDTHNRIHETGVFYRFGLGNVHCIASTSGSGTGELLDAIWKKLKLPDDNDSVVIPKFAIIGRPNVGKSSLLNTLVGEERTIVTSIAGTTRDAIHTRYKAYGYDFILIDTAGLRKKGKVHEDIEFYSVMRTVKAIEEADICLLMIDATSGIEGQDLNIFHLAEKNKKGIVILVNKWDLVKKGTHTAKEMKADIKAKTAPFTDIPIVFISAINKQRVLKALQEALNVYQNRQKKITTSELNKVMLPVIEQYPPPAYRGKYIKIKYITQLPTRTPGFAFFCNHPKYIQESYKRFLENKLREHFDYSGVPISIFMRSKN